MSYLNDALARLVAMEKAMKTGSDAYPYAQHWQENFPYWTNAIESFEPGEYEGDDNSQRIYVAVIRYHAGYRTEGSYGDVEAAIYTDLPTLQTAFEENPGLQSTAYTTPLTGLDPLETRLLSSPVLAIIGKSSATGNDILGAIFRLQLIFNISINPK